MLSSKKNGCVSCGVFAVLLLIFTTILCFIPILFIGVAKIFPNLRWKTRCTQLVDKIATFWSATNNAYIDRFRTIQWEIEGIDNLSTSNWYFVIANHQSWLDIVVLQKLFNRKIPILKFFIKDQLKWIPFLGFSWWAMGCPFMKRYSKEYLLKKPHKKGKDLLATRKALKLFEQMPAAIMNFVEGTRFTDQKSKLQQSPYQHLLKPKAGGISFVLSTMGEKFKSMLDVTIIYSNKNPTLWDFLCKRINRIQIHVRQIPIPSQFMESSFYQNEEAQTEFRDWLNLNWETKDNLISTLKMQ